MSDTVLDFAAALISKHEGFRSTVYVDTRGKRTIGYGFNLDDPTAEETCKEQGLEFYALLKGMALSPQDAAEIRDKKILAAQFAARCLVPNMDKLPVKAQGVVLDMLYNMGSNVFGKFHDTIDALIAGDVKKAAICMQQSDWYREVGDRGIEDCALMSTAAEGA